jgi:hypothetical protein
LLELSGGNYFGGTVGTTSNIPHYANDTLGVVTFDLWGVHHDRQLFPRKQFLEPNKVRLRKTI